MDPLTALGLATSVIQFVQFAGKLISESQEAYESASGMSCRNINLENIANDLLNLHHQLLKDASRTPRAKLSAAEEHLQRLTRESIQVAERLIRVVQGLKSRGGNKRWKSVRHALTSAWKQKDIAALQTRLVEIRQQLDTALLICLRLFVKEIKTQHKELLQAIRKYEEKPSEIEMQRFSAQLEATADLSIEGRFCKLILAHLEFTDIQDRYERICPAHRQTFEWIFKESDDGDSTWDNFPIWLSSFTDKNFYWVTGKAGSGKSTLMKHIFDDERTRQHLKVWSKGRRLLSGGFFFWNSGTEIQMSRNGLLRTLLYQILNDHPSLIKQTIRGGFRDQWIWQELKQAFKILAQDDTICLALFIDGLDEFDGDHEELAEFLLKLSSPRIKICAASRPWLVFEDIFENGPSLLLERLTRKDIQLYLQKLNRALASSLIEELVEKSSGVFLWVNLVTRSLLQGMANADRMSELKRRLASLPMDLEELFEKLLRSLDPFYFSHAAQLVQILKAAPVPPKPLEMSYADDEDPTAAINATIRPLTVSEQAERSETMRRRLNSRCKGLIGVSQYGNSNLERVEFLHRTVKDFFDKPGIWADIIDATPKTFDAYQCCSMGHSTC
ncbi:hypothetical protein CC78DRAFT_555500 [Lojkania enalia]|uniref:NACHT domain-containing protein n=1 Tax=Lojkania enalia TaxID=147567 RepID=A0A9P4K0I5_9PLEO|nr:hypothetical protein CC78DRAFT_555500 [Didymosphaeria enalia]